MPFGFGAPLASFWGPVTGALIGGVGAKSANKETARSTAKQIAFQREMSNTAHQRQVKDLRAAGINPMLSAKLGGASTPQGASYTAQNVGSAAVQGYQAVSSARQAQAQTRLTNEQTGKASEERKQAVMNTKMLERNGIAPMEVIYTPKNIMGSEIYSAFKNYVSGKNVAPWMQAIFDKFVPDFVKKQEKVLQQGTPAPAGRSNITIYNQQDTGFWKALSEEYAKYKRLRGK
jgi:hypothetical protein